MATEVQTIETAVGSDVKNGVSWLKVHERIIITVVVVLAMVFGANKYLNVVSNRDNQQATVARQQLAEQQTKDQAAAAATASDTKQYQALVTTLSQQNTQLAAAAANRTIVLQQQQTADKTLPMPDLGNRWTQLAGLKQGDLTATTEGITVTPQGALDTVVQLEQVPVLRANLADAQAQNTNSQAELAKANTVIGDQTKQITGLNTTLTDQKTADAKELSVVKADARKGKLKAFCYGVGVGVGAVVGIVIHHAL